MDSFETNPGAPKQGSYLAVIIVILIIALGGAYFWYARAHREPVKQNIPPNAEVMTDEELQRELEATGNIDISADMKSFDEVYK